MKAMLVAIQPKWLKMILDGDKNFEFRNWKVPVGTVLYFYCTKAFPALSHGYTFGNLMLLDKKEYNTLITMNKESYAFQNNEFDYDNLLNGKVVAKAVVKDVGKITNWGLGLELTDKDGFFICDIDIATAYKIGWNWQTYALELDQVQAIEPKDITEFVSWSKLDKARKERNKKEDIQTALKYGDWQMEYDTTDKFVDYYGTPKECKLTKPPQSRTWIYVK